MNEALEGSAASGSAASGPVASGPVVEIRRLGPGGSMASDNAFALALLNLWQRVAEAGGAVGFGLPVERSQVGAAASAVVADLRSGRAYAYAAALGREVIGIAVLRPGIRVSAHTGLITSVMVDPNYQGRGIGGRLMQAVLDLATQKGIELVRVEVRAGAGLERFYSGHGFRETGRLPGWVRVSKGDDRDLVLMGTEIGPDPSDAGPTARPV